MLTVALLTTATESCPMFSGPSDVEDLMLVFIIVLTRYVGKIVCVFFVCRLGSVCITSFSGGGVSFVAVSPVVTTCRLIIFGDFTSTALAELDCCLACFSWGEMTSKVCFFFGDFVGNITGTTTGSLIKTVCCCLGDLIAGGRAAADGSWLMAVGLFKVGLAGAEISGFVIGRDKTSDSFRTLAAGAFGESVLLVLPSLPGKFFVGVGILTVVALGSLVSFSFS